MNKNDANPVGLHPTHPGRTPVKVALRCNSFRGITLSWNSFLADRDNNIATTKKGAGRLALNRFINGLGTDPMASF
jgi:hypothetical protein